MGYYDYGWQKYVSVAERKQKAAKHINSLKKKGATLNPVVIEGRSIATTFWGKAWCDNLESYSDYENRLPRGRTYVRNGSVIDLQVTKGLVKAQVMGSSLYNISITIKPMIESKWKALIDTCAGKIDSMIELLQGKFSKAVMKIITEKEVGLFPNPKEISMKCSCPDHAGMCKHIAAVLYGIGSSLDIKPEWLFCLRHVDHMDLIATAGTAGTLIQGNVGADLAEEDLSSMFGIEMDSGQNSLAPKTPPKKTKAKPKTSTKAKSDTKKKKVVRSKTKTKEKTQNKKKAAN